MARILLIDDDHTFRTALRLILVNLGHTVIEACDGAEGLNLFSSANVDLVITDIVMPEKEGLEVLMALRKKQQPVMVIAMSGNAMLLAADNLRVAKLMGAAKVLEKPFSREVLMMAIDETLTSGRTLVQTAQDSGFPAC